MKTLTILGAVWLWFELANVLKNDFKIKVSSRTKDKLKIYEEEGFDSYILNEENLTFLDELLDTNYLFINFPPSKFEDYLSFLNKIYSSKKIKEIEKQQIKKGGSSFQSYRQSFCLSFPTDVKTDVLTDEKLSEFKCQYG